MPHIVIEYPASLANQTDLNDLCEKLFHAAEKTGIFPNPEDIKVRALAASHSYRATQDQSFVHVTVLLLSGRTPEQKRNLSDQVIKALDTALPNVGSLTVDIKDMDRETYSKRVL